MTNIYEMPLRERFERADEVFSAIYLAKARLHRKGLRTYTDVEFRHDLYEAAGDQGLFGEALWLYFKVLHRPKM